MSTEAAARRHAAAPSDASRRTLRLGFGVALGFAVAEYFDWSFSFLPPMLAVSLLAQPRCPTLREGVAMVLAMALAMGFALALTAGLITQPAPLVLGLALVLFLTFYAQARGAPDGAVFLLQVAVIAEPVLAVLSWSLAQSFASIMVGSACVALLIAWSAHAVLPDRGGAAVAAKPAAVRVDAGPAVRQAMARTLILVPPLAWFVLDATQVALVCIMVVLMVVRRFEPGMGSKVAMGLVLGNLAGGLLAALVYNLVQAQGTIGFFTVTCLVVSLVLADAVARAGTFAPVVTIAFTTFILVLGLGLSPLPGGSGDTFSSRMINVLIASAYAVGALALLVRPAPSAPPPVEESGGERDAGGGERRDAPA